MLDQRQELYIPRDERDLRRVQRRLENLEREVRAWANSVIDALPQGITLLPEERRILSLFLAQQRRLNLEIDAQQQTDQTLRRRLGSLLPFRHEDADEKEIVRSIHREVAARLDSDIESACESFCLERGIPPVCDPSIDWRVAIRYMAQGIHRVARQVETPRRLATSPRRFELALLARDLALEATAKRRDMLTIFAAGGPRS